MPDLAYGKQVIRIFSHLVAPSARAASWWSAGVWRMVSRDMEVMIGRIMIARTTPAVKMVPPPAMDTLPSLNRKNQPRFWLSHSAKGTIHGPRTIRPHMP